MFDGETYDDAEDRERLSSALEAVRAIMKDSDWHTLYDLQKEMRYEFDLHSSLPAISARVRDLRKEKFGGHVVARRRIAAIPGLWEYRLES